MDMINIFPVPVGKSNISRPLTDDENKAFEEVGKDIIANTYNTRSGNFYVLELPGLAQLKQEILAQVNKFAKTVYNPVETARLRITQSWVNYSSAGQAHHAHTHFNSLISGVFYPRAVANLDKISFHFTRPSQILLNSAGATYYSSTYHEIGVTTGDIVLFPSWLEHNVPSLPANYEGVRSSLAFNVFPENELGLDHMLTKLNIVFPE